jgi:hypothetical protein
MRNAYAVIVILACLTCGCAGPASHGKFTGEVQTRWLDDGRRMALLAPINYVDPDGVRWIAPTGAIVDGASIPRFAWSVIGGPFEGKYRKASVIHDVACQVQKRPWESVHEMFYHAMLASDVGELKAKTMYAAVYHFGPRWTIRYEIKEVPRDAVAATVDQLKARAEPGTEVQATVSGEYVVRRRPSVFATKEEEFPVADLEVQVRPSIKALQESDFAGLNSAINKKDMSLKEIRDYRPPPPMNLRIQ